LKQEGKHLFLQSYVKSYEGVSRIDEAIEIVRRLQK